MDESVSANRTQVDFGLDTNSDLLAYIGLRVEDEASARDALAEFSARHRDWLQSAVKRSRFKEILGESIADDIVQETLKLVWEKAESFKPTATDPDGDRRSVRGWLGQIANRVGASMLRSTDALVVATSLSAEVELIPASNPNRQEPRDVQIAREELEQLSDRERDVVLEWLLHFKPYEDHQRLPNEVSKLLAERWCTTPESIRQIRSRTLRRLREAIANRTGRQL